MGCWHPGGEAHVRNNDNDEAMMLVLGVDEEGGTTGDGRGRSMDLKGQAAFSLRYVAPPILP